MFRRRAAANPPNVVVQPQYGPDQYARSMAVANSLNANPMIHAVTGIGVSPPDPGNLEGHSDALYAPIQNYLGWRGAITRPAFGNTAKTSQFPNTSSPTDTSLKLLALDARSGQM